MCGIAGHVAAASELVDAAALDRALTSLSHRGPDDSGWLMWCRDGSVRKGRPPVGSADARVGLVSTRLAILDLSTAGWQPMTSADGHQHIVYNGEIYNYLELRGELEALGYRFTTRTDTEVLLSAWAAWGGGALARLVGMFAFAILDTHLGELVLARDHFGIKPLFVSQSATSLAFASEIRPLLHLRDERGVDPDGLYDYLRWGLVDHGEQSLFASIRRFPAGHFARIDLRDPALVIRSQPFWAIPAERREVAPSDAADEIRRMFLDSIRMHLRSDVPVGAALSGGIDSSAIVAGARLMGGPDLDLRCYSYIADDARLNEEKWVDLAASAARVPVSKVRVTPADLVADLDALILAQGEPFATTSIFAQWAVFRAARRDGVIVLLDGQGADELFAGYRLLLGAKVRDLLREGRRVAGFRLAARVAREDGSAVVARAAVRALAPRLPPPLRRMALATGSATAYPSWLREDWFHGRGSAGSRDGRQPERLHDLLLSMFRSTRLPSLLRFEDRNSMHFSLESRVPFLYPPLVEFVFSLPLDALMDREGRSKVVFRQAMRDIVPAAILARRDKIGFETPETRWLRELRPWIERTLGAGAARAIPALRHDVVERQWRPMVDGERSHDPVLWRWLNVIRWAAVYEVDFGPSTGG